MLATSRFSTSRTTHVTHRSPVVGAAGIGRRKSYAALRRKTRTTADRPHPVQTRRRPRDDANHEYRSMAINIKCLERGMAEAPGFQACSRNTPKALQNGAKTAATEPALATGCGAWQSQGGRGGLTVEARRRSASDFGALASRISRALAST